MHVIKLNSKNFWEVGHYSPDGAWHVSLEFSSKYEAMSYVSYFNGGQIPPSYNPTTSKSKSK